MSGLRSRGGARCCGGAAVRPTAADARDAVTRRARGVAAIVGALLAELPMLVSAIGDLASMDAADRSAFIRAFRDVGHLVHLVAVPDSPPCVHVAESEGVGTACSGPALIFTGYLDPAVIRMVTGEAADLRERLARAAEDTAADELEYWTDLRPDAARLHLLYARMGGVEKVASALQAIYRR